MSRIMIFCWVIVSCLISCFPSSPRFSRSTVLWCDQLEQLNQCKSYDQFKMVASKLGFVFRADEKVKDIRILSYTRTVSSPKGTQTYTQVLGYYENLYIPKVAFTTPIVANPDYYQGLKKEAVKEKFKLLGDDYSGYRLKRDSDGMKLFVSTSYNASGTSILTVEIGGIL